MKRPVSSCRVGAGLRAEHYPRLLSGAPVSLAWFEAVSENYMDSEGRPIRALESVRRDFPVALHGVSMSVGSADGVDPAYLERLKALADRVDPFLVTDHLCWTGAHSRNLHDLLPLPYNQETLDWVGSQVQRAQEALGRTLALENVSSYLSWQDSDIPEAQFLAELARRTGCGILLDVNNVYVNARNHGFSAEAYVDALPPEAVRQIHLAGHADMGDYLFDTHAAPVADPVWTLFDRVIRRLPDVPFMIEWDDDIPPFERLEAESLKAADVWARHHGSRTAPETPVRAG